jgi:hypothetical protein
MDTKFFIPTYSHFMAPDAPNCTESDSSIACHKAYIEFFNGLYFYIPYIKWFRLSK